MTSTDDHRLSVNIMLPHGLTKGHTPELELLNLELGSLGVCKSEYLAYCRLFGSKICHGGGGGGGGSGGSGAEGGWGVGCTCIIGTGGGGVVHAV